MEESVYIGTSEIIGDILGEPYRGLNPSGWTEYDCPNCSQLEGLIRDGKHNLCINYNSGTYHCWKCGDRGNLFSLVRKYGQWSDKKKFNNCVASIKASAQYKLRENSLIKEETPEEVYVDLPKCCQKIDIHNKQAQRAYEYLQKRGVDNYLIQKHNLHFVGYIKKEDKENTKYRQHIFIPSYDDEGFVNYWVARDFSGKTKYKYLNPNINKTAIVFNSFLINEWEDITLVEGPFDHIVVPNSIPLLGKILSLESKTFEYITKYARANVNILLDGDAYQDAVKIYWQLQRTPLKNRVRIIKCPDDYDASLIYQESGYKGIFKLFKEVVNPST